MVIPPLLFTHVGFASLKLNANADAASPISAASRETRRQEGRKAGDIQESGCYDAPLTLLTPLFITLAPLHTLTPQRPSSSALSTFNSSFLDSLEYLLGKNKPPLMPSASSSSSHPSHSSHPHHPSTLTKLIKSIRNRAAALFRRSGRNSDKGRESEREHEEEEVRWYTAAPSKPHQPPTHAEHARNTLPPHAPHTGTINRRRQRIHSLPPSLTLDGLEGFGGDLATSVNEVFERRYRSVSSCGILSGPFSAKSMSVDREQEREREQEKEQECEREETIRRQFECYDDDDYNHSKSGAASPLFKNALTSSPPKRIGSTSATSATPATPATPPHKSHNPLRNSDTSTTITTTNTANTMLNSTTLSTSTLTADSSIIKLVDFSGVDDDLKLFTKGDSPTRYNNVLLFNDVAQDNDIEIARFVRPTRTRQGIVESHYGSCGTCDSSMGWYGGENTDKAADSCQNAFEDAYLNKTCSSIDTFGDTFGRHTLAQRDIIKAMYGVDAA